MHTRRRWLLVAGPTALMMATGACGGDDAKVSSGTGSGVTNRAGSPGAPVASIKDGQVDFAIAAYRITDAAKQQVDFAGPYFVAGQDLLVRSGDTTIKGISDLAGKKVCSSRVTGTAVQNVRAKAPDAESIQMDTTPQCTDALTEGRVDAVASVNTSLLGPLEKSAGALRLVANPSTEEPNGIGIKRGDDAFRAFINDQLEKSFAGGQWAEAYATTLGRFGWRTPKPPAVDRYLAAAPAATSTSRP